MPTASVIGQDGDGDSERDAGADDEAAEDVAAELVGAEPMLARGRRPGVDQAGVGEAVGRDERRGKRHDQHEADQHRPDHGVALAQEAAPEILPCRPERGRRDRLDGLFPR